MFVYVIVNHSNGKLYVGKTVTKNLSHYLSRQFWCAQNPDKSRTSKPYLFNAMRKYPAECWSIHPLISDAKTHEELLYWEQIIIKALSTQKHGYNICAGGRGTIGWKPSVETRAKNRASNIGKKHKPFTPEQEARRLVAWQKSVDERIASGNYHGSQEALDKIRTARAEQDEAYRLQKFSEFERAHGADRRKRAAVTHRGKKHVMSETGSAKISETFALIAHNRWHVKRGLRNSTCKLCSEGI